MGEFSVTWGSNDTSASNSSLKPKPMCHCGDPLLLLKSKTQGNPGRRFYRCRNYKLKSYCGFFEWAEELSDDGNKELILTQKALIKSLEATVETLKILLIISWVIVFVVWYRQ